MAEDCVIGAFSEQQAAQLSGVTLNQLRRWDRDDFLKPSFGSEHGVPYGRVYSFRDIVSLRVLNDLRNNVGCSLQYLKKLSETLSHLGDSKWTATTLHVLGKKVIVGEAGMREEAVSRQRVLDIPLRLIIASTRRAVLDLNKRDIKVGQIVRSKFVSQNEYVMAGTRIKVSAIQDFAKAGYSASQIVRQYPILSKADIDAALEFDVDRQAA